MIAIINDDIEIKTLTKPEVAAATLGSNNSTSITVTTPVGTAGAKNVIVTTPGGSVTSNGAFTYSSGLSVGDPNLITYYLARDRIGQTFKIPNGNTGLLTSINDIHIYCNIYDPNSTSGNLYLTLYSDSNKTKLLSTGQVPISVPKTSCNNGVISIFSVPFAIPVAVFAGQTYYIELENRNPSDQIFPGRNFGFD